MKKNFIIFYLILYSSVIDFYPKNEQKPRVSIITSVYKCEKFIRGFLEDIVRQTIFNECELIMINANSPENEEQIIFDYLEKHRNIRYVRIEQDPGLYGVWNIGIRVAKAPLIANANTDDRFVPNLLEIHAEALEKHPEIDLVYSDFYETRFPNETFEHNSFNGFTNHPEFSPREIAHGSICGPHPMWRKDVHKKVGLFNPWFKSAGDYDMWLRMVIAGCQFMKINQITGLYYHNPNGLSTTSEKFQAKHRSAEEKYIKNRYKGFFKKYNAV